MMNLPSWMNANKGVALDTTAPESSHGGPVYDARIDPAITTADIVSSQRLAVQRNIHLYGEKSAPAEAFSHFTESQPAPMAIYLMGLANQRDQIEKIVQRKDAQPFPGVALGHVPAFAEAPNTNPVMQPFDHFRHNAHQIETKKASRRRFGH